MACAGCNKQDESKLTEEEILKNKRIISWAAWFVSPEWKLLRFNSNEHIKEDLPIDGFLCAKTKFVDGTGENIGGNGWIVFIETPHGLIFQATGDNNPPDPARYPNAKFIKDKLAPASILTIAQKEQEQWQ